MLAIWSMLMSPTGSEGPSGDKSNCGKTNESDAGGYECNTTGSPRYESGTGGRAKSAGNSSSAKGLLNMLMEFVPGLILT